MVEKTSQIRTMIEKYLPSLPPGTVIEASDVYPAVRSDLPAQGVYNPRSPRAQIRGKYEIGSQEWSDVLRDITAPVGPSVFGKTKRQSDSAATLSEKMFLFEPLPDKC